MTEGSNDDLKVIKPDAGLAFRAEMYGTNVILGYWKVIAGVIAAFLVCVLLYGQYQNWYLQKQEETSSETAHLLKMFSDEYPEFIFAGATGDGYTPLTITENPKLLKDVRLAAQKLKEIGDSGSGSGAAYSYLMSAEFSRYAGDLELRKTALQASSNAGGIRSDALGRWSWEGGFEKAFYGHSHLSPVPRHDGVCDQFQESCSRSHT